MARKCVERKQRDVESEDERADTDAEVAVEEEGVNGVVPKKNDEQNREVKEIAMDILEDERKSGFAAIVTAGRFTDGTGGWVPEECAVVGFAIVITCCSKSQGGNENQQGGRKPSRQPVMLRIDKRRIKRREVRAPLVILAFEGAQCGINAETAEHNNDRENFDPPWVAPQSTAEARFGHKSRGTSHSVTSGVRVGYAKNRVFKWIFDKPVRRGLQRI